MTSDKRPPDSAICRRCHAFLHEHESKYKPSGNSIIAVCESCHTVYLLAADLTGELPGTLRTKAVAMPRRFNTKRNGVYLEITYGAELRGFLSLMLFILFITFIAILATGVAIGHSSEAGWAIVLGSMYFGTICFLLFLREDSMPTVIISPNSLKVKPGPLSFTKELALNTIEDIFTFVEFKKGEDEDHFMLYALTSDGKNRKLLNLLDPERALYFEQELKRFLGIADISRT